MRECLLKGTFKKTLGPNKESLVVKLLKIDYGVKSIFGNNITVKMRAN